MLAPLDPILHAELRLAVVSLLMTVKSAEFKYLKEHTKASSGNLSIQIKKLKDAGYITVNKTFKNNYPLTECKMTKAGIKAFEAYTNTLKSYLGL